jgi:branched-chain amino acid transport system ATP-binding protein
MSSSAATAEPGTATTSGPTLEVIGLTAGYRGRSVIYDVDLTVGRGEVVVLLGSNGAGKTTTLKAITGLVKPTAGNIRINGERWRTDRPWRAVRKGLAFTPSERFTFASMTVRENLRLGAIRTPAVREEQEARLLELFPILSERRNQLAGTMSGGQQRQLSLAVALMSRPTLMLLDEPSLGLQPTIVATIMEALGRLAAETELSILMVEQNVGQALTIADRTYVMRSGRIILSESAEAMRARDQWWELF